MSIEDRLEILEDEKNELLQELYKDEKRAVKFFIGKCFEDSVKDYIKVLDYKDGIFNIVELCKDIKTISMFHESFYYVKSLYKNGKVISNEEFNTELDKVIEKIKG